MPTTSPSNERYTTPELDARAVELLMRELGLARVVAGLLVLRGYDTTEAAQKFLSPDLARDWHDPHCIPGLEEVADRVELAVRGGEHILVFGDFDTDGVTATAILMRALAHLGGEVEPLIPLRLTEGYGLTPAVADRIVERHPDLVVTVDNGIAARDEAAELVARGIDIAITDHHEPGGSVPVGVPMADPKIDPECPSRNLAGAGVALKLVQLLGERMGEPDLWLSMLDLAALGTIGDQMPLTGENRAIVTYGLRQMNQRPSTAITAFQAKSERPSELTSDGLSYSLIPRINSAGRMGDAAVALDLLLAETQPEALACMDALEQVNEERRAAEFACSESALSQASVTYHGEHCVVLAGEDWHEGVKGIVASRIVSKYNVPAILFAVRDDGLAHGSGRSVGSVDLFHAVEEACAGTDLLVRFGGHAAAVGVTVASDRIDEFRSRLDAYLATLPPEQYITRPRVDMEVDLPELSLDLCEDIQLLAPFGQENPVPTFVTRSVLMADRRGLGTPPAHFACRMTDGRADVRSIWFHPPQLDELIDCDRAVDIVYRAEVNEYRGNRSPQLHLLDVSYGGWGERGDAETEEYLEGLFARSEECLDTSEYAGILDASSFHTKVAGVTFEGRQEVLKQLVAPCPLRLVRDPENAYDENAIAVCAGAADASGQDRFSGQIGFLNARLATRLAPVIDEGVPYDAILEQVTGGEEGRSYGANILVCRHDVADDENRRLAELAEMRQHWAGVPRDQVADEVRLALIGEHSLHDAQARSLDLLAQGSNVLCVMATGRGKSLIFQMHAAVTALTQGRASIFIYPLRALVADQAFHLRDVFARFGLIVEVLTGESSEDERTRIFDGLSDGSISCVLTTPEFLTIHASQFAATGRVGFLVVDEAHHVGLARAGHRSAYGSLGSAIETLGDPTVLAVTATASPEVADAIRRDLRIDETVLDATRRENLKLDDDRDVRGRDTLLAHVVGGDGKTVVYVNSREQTIQIARNLRKANPQKASRIAFYNAGLSRADRTRIERAFRDGLMDTIVSTSAFGEGVDIPDIRDVVLYHLPFNAVEFNQMAGRAGRDGRESHIHLLFSRRDARINEKILSSGAPSRDDMSLLYRVLRKHQRDVGTDEHFQATNADLAEECLRLDSRCALTDSGVSSAIQIFRELSFLETFGHGQGRRIHLFENPQRADLESSVRYCEGLEECDEFQTFSEWAFAASPEELLSRFDRPILPE